MYWYGIFGTCIFRYSNWAQKSDLVPFFGNFSTFGAKSFVDFFIQRQKVVILPTVDDGVVVFLGFFFFYFFAFFENLKTCTITTFGRISVWKKMEKKLLVVLPKSGNIGDLRWSWTQWMMAVDGWDWQFFKIFMHQGD